MKLSRFAAILILAATAAFAQEMSADYASVLKTLGKQGDYKANVLKINIPRNDLRVSIDGSATRVLETAKRNVHRPVKFTSGFRPGPDNYRCRGQDLCRVGAGNGLYRSAVAYSLLLHLTRSSLHC